MMVKEIKMFEATDGSIHKCSADAERADLIHLLQFGEAINSASATKLADMLISDDSYRASMLNSLRNITSKVMALKDTGHE